MKKYFSTATLLAGLLGSSMAFAQHETGGFLPTETLYVCTQTDQSIGTIEAVLTKTLDTLDLRVESFTPQMDHSEVLYVGQVTLNKTIQCFIECELYENTADQAGLFLTMMPDKTITGNFNQGNASTAISCVRGEKPAQN